MGTFCTRRNFLKTTLGSASLLTLGGIHGCGGGGATSSSTPPDVNDDVIKNIAVGAGVLVPQKFLGMHFHYWPDHTLGPVSPDPDFSFGTWRNHDYYGNNSNGFRWLNLNPTFQATINDIYASASVAWSELDAVIQVQTAAGRDIYFTLYGTPAWAARNEFVINPAGVSPSAPLQDVNALNLFVSALLSRYNYSGSTTPIRYLEIWNEPNFRGNSACTFSSQILTWEYSESNSLNTGMPLATGDRVFFTTSGTMPSGLIASTPYYVTTTNGSDFTVASTANGSAINVSGGSGTLSCHELTAFFWGQSAEMAAMAKIVYQAAKAIDPDVIVVSPGFTGGLNPKDNQISSFLAASDGTGGTGANWCDAIAFHPYDTTVSGAIAIPDLYTVIQAVRDLVTTAGLPAAMPLLVGEQGWQSSSGVAQSYFFSETPANQAKKIVRHALISAASGMEKHIFYDYDGPYLGTPSVADSPLKQELLHWFHNTICGQTIVSCDVLASGAVSVTLATEARFVV